MPLPAEAITCVAPKEKRVVGRLHSRRFIEAGPTQMPEAQPSAQWQTSPVKVSAVEIEQALSDALNGQ